MFRSSLVFLAVLTAMSSTTARAASIQPISPTQCVWHAGDDPAWAAPSLNEAGWQPLNSWKVSPDQTWMWVRCHADLLALQQASHPALQVNTARAFQFFLNGKLISHNGNMSNGQASINSEQIVSLPASDFATSLDTLSLRVRVRSTGDLREHADGPLITAGEIEWLRDRHNSEALANVRSLLPVVVGFSIIGVLGFILLALYLNDRSHLELLLLAVACWCLATIRLCDLCWASMASVPASAWWMIYGIGETAAVWEVWFMFRLARRRVPLAYKLFAAVTLCWLILSVNNAFLPASMSLRFQSSFEKWAWDTLFVAGLTATSSYAAFWPWRRIPRGMRAMAACAMLWGLVDMIWFSTAASSHLTPTRDALFASWRPILLELRGFVTFSAIASLIALLFREHRRTAQERAVLAGEMQAAQQIQRILASTTLDTAAGARVEVAFRPMRDVGGDFYLCRALPDGRQRILIGDVSGKGAAAAMTATLLIGAAGRRAADSPAELLSHLNLVLHESQVGGFATCLCADLKPNGEVTLANAGHLSPYLHGKEIALEPGLPLGLSQSQSLYSEHRLHLAEGDTLTFLSDGVVEARSVTGELFGFERAQAISAQPAQAIAEAAEEYGQEDDITVLTLTRTPTPAPKVATIAIPEMA